MNLYKFEKLSARLDELGYESIASNGVRIMKRDLTQETNAGNIEFREDGVYLKIDGNEYKGYMYHKYPNIDLYGLPKFHITECNAVREQKLSGRFDNNYYWQNSNVVTLIDRATKREHKDVKLVLCGYCNLQSKVIYKNTEDFFETMGSIMEEVNTEFEVDIMGYPIKPINWYELSRNFRIKMNYTCANSECGITITEPRDRRFIHVHHKDGNKLNCNVNNLECLCVLCHANEDEMHLANFQKKRMKSELNAFVKIYHNELARLGNKFLSINT